MINDTMAYNADHYTPVALAVIGELQCYPGQIYAAPFVSELDYERLGRAIQRAVMSQMIYEIAQVFGGKIPEAEALFPGLSIPEPAITQ